MTSGIFHRIRIKKFTICTETERPWIAKAILRKENGAGGIRHSDFRLYYSNQNILVQAQKEKYRPMEQYRKSREKLIHVCPPMTKKARMYNGAQSFQ